MKKRLKQLRPKRIVQGLEQIQSKVLFFFIAAGPESLEYYFQKGSLLGQKVTPNIWYLDARPISRVFEGLSYLAYEKFNIQLFFRYIFYSHNSIVSFQ